MVIRSRSRFSFSVPTIAVWVRVEYSRDDGSPVDGLGGMGYFSDFSDHHSS